MAAYQTYFQQFLLTLPISRPGFRVGAQFTYDAVRAAGLGGLFPAALTQLETAIGGLDVNLQVRGTSTADDTEAQRRMRAKIVAFVDDTLIDLVKPKLRKLVAYKSFKGLGKTEFKRIKQHELLGRLDVFAGLLTANAATLGPAAGTEAAQLVAQWETVTKERTESTEEIDQSILDLALDWVAVARALRRIQLLLLLQFIDEADGGEARAYAYFNFSETFKALAKTPAPVVAPTPNA